MCRHTATYIPRMEIRFLPWRRRRLTSSWTAGPRGKGIQPSSSGSPRFRQSRGPKPAGDAQGVVLDEAGGFLDISGRTPWQGCDGFSRLHALCDERIGKLLDAIAHVSRAVSRRSGDRVPMARGDIGGLSLSTCDVLSEKLRDAGPGKDSRDVIERREARSRADWQEKRVVLRMGVGVGDEDVEDVAEFHAARTQAFGERGGGFEAGFAVGVVMALQFGPTLFLSMYGVMFLITQYFQLILGYSPLEAIEITPPIAYVGIATLRSTQGDGMTLRVAINMADTQEAALLTARAVASYVAEVLSYEFDQHIKTFRQDDHALIEEKGAG